MTASGFDRLPAAGPEVEVVPDRSDLVFDFTDQHAAPDVRCDESLLPQCTILPGDGVSKKRHSKLDRFAILWYKQRCATQGGKFEGRRMQIGIKVRQFPVPAYEFPVPAKQIRCSVQNRESSVTPWNCRANGRRNPAESGETAGNFKNSLLFSLFCGNSRRFGIAGRVPPPAPAILAKRNTPFFASEIRAFQRGFSPPPCGEGSGVGVVQWGTCRAITSRPPTPTLPHKGGGSSSAPCPPPITTASPPAPWRTPCRQTRPCPA
jgi:hypothetical protein